MTGLGSARSVRQRRFFGARDAPVSRVWQWQSPNRPRSRRQRACVAMLPPRAGPTRTEVDHHWFRLVSGRAVTGLCAAPFGPTTAPSPSPGGVENSHARRGYSSRTTKGAWLEKGPRTVRSHSQRRPMRLPGAAETAAGRWPGTIPSECRLVRPARTPTTRNRTAATTATLLHLTSVSRAPYAATFATLPPGP